MKITISDEQLDMMLRSLEEDEDTVNNSTNILTLTAGDEIYLKALHLKIVVK